MKYLVTVLMLTALSFAQDAAETEPAPDQPVQLYTPAEGNLPDIAPFFRLGAGVGVQIHQGGTWRNPYESATEFHGGEWEGFNAAVSNLSMGVLIRPADVAVTIDNTSAWFNTQGFWGDDPFMCSSVTAIMGTYYPSEHWSVGGGGGLFLLGTPFNDNGTLSGPAGMVSFGRRLSDAAFVEGRVFLGIIRQDHSLMSDAKTIIGINLVVNTDLVF
jgi:hypothetical protein